MREALRVVGVPTRLQDLSSRWTVSNLKRCLLSLLGQGQIGTKYCLFIDGLDEFEDEREDLVEFLHNAAQSPWVKLCVASRPYNLFEKTFQQSPQLALQDLTRTDITEYVRSRLNVALRLHGGTVLRPEDTERLTQLIVSKANGV